MKLTRAITGLVASLLVVSGALSAVSAYAYANANVTATLFVDGAFGGTAQSGCASQSSPCTSIDAALAAGNALSDTAVTIDVAAGTYDESLVVTPKLGNTVDIEGAGASTTVVDDAGSASDVVITSGTVSVNGLSLTGGAAQDGGGVLIATGSVVTLKGDDIEGDSATSNGGGVYVDGTATLSNDVISNDNAGAAGGGVDNNGFPTALTLTNDTISNDTAVTQGGGVNNIYSLVMTDDTLSNDVADVATTDSEGGGVDNFGTETISNDTFTNDAAEQGGGIFDAGQGAVTDSSFSGDDATVNGGGIDGGGTQISDDTFANDTATDNGGGIYIGALDMFNNTFVDDSAGHDGGGIVDGGVDLKNFTFTGDEAQDMGGAVYTQSTSSITISNSLFSHNIALSGANCSGKVIDGGYNVADDSSCDFGSSSMSSSLSIGTLTLAANGSSGPETVAILPSSSAFNEVPKSACSPTTDERGLPRPGAGDGNCDAGAFEVQGTPQSIHFGGSTKATVGAKSVLEASGGGSGNPVIFSVARASANVCKVSGKQIRFVKTGICKIDANQAGNGSYNPAVQAVHSITVKKRKVR